MTSTPLPAAAPLALINCTQHDINLYKGTQLVLSIKRVKDNGLNLMQHYMSPSEDAFECSSTLKIDTVPPPMTVGLDLTGYEEWFDAPDRYALVTSALTAEHIAKHKVRKNVFAPATSSPFVVRSANGTIVGTTALVRYA